ncbi:uncharacterized protein LTR77_004116 [Saxophila tyrrhenica]|uniref:NAD-dependent epimerase/dehydratase domain-containing protein n=1 Tax=Saxophila tyrrhenica TaxID=1690608 RepID=A0AAV9PBW2_9PEZI|nr:hypothetical protein LTR77_004116 [Saxophila tyrrhenica]
MSTIEKGDLVLITGCSGYIASQTANQFLEAGYRVRGTVRSKEKVEWLYALFDAKYGKGKFEHVVVPDMMAEGAFDEAVEGVAGVCHTASVMKFSGVYDEVVPAVVKGALNALTAATKEPKMKSFVYTSSSTAALMPQPDKEIHVTKDTWNDQVVHDAQTAPNPWNVYGASKTEAERAIWKAVKETSPPFQVAAVLPNANLGPILQPGAENSSSTASWPLQLWNGDTSVTTSVPPQYFVDVRDTARLHVIAMIDPACNGERIFAFAAPFTWNDILAVLRKQNPGREFPADMEGGGRDMSVVPNGEAEALLRKHYGKGWTGLEEVVEANTATVR